MNADVNHDPSRRDFRVHGEHAAAYDDDTKQESIIDEHVNPQVVDFLRSLYNSFEDRSITDLQNHYDINWATLSDRYYSNSRWPSADTVKLILGEDVDAIFIVIYKWLYYRHIHERLKFNLIDIFDRYSNYCDLFNYILCTPMMNAEDPSGNQMTKGIDLPNKWVWDIMDDFVTQFENFSLLKEKQFNLAPNELEYLAERSDCWDVHNILNVLYSIINTSRMNEQIMASYEGGDLTSSAGPFGTKPMYRMFGYASLVCLMRVHCSLGDYSLALKTVQHLDFSRKSIFCRVYSCYVTAHYYLGFTYMMLRRYSSAVNTFTNILLFALRVKNPNLRHFQSDEVMRRIDSVYALLAICVSITRQRTDENIHNVLREKHGDDIIKLQRGAANAVSVAAGLFESACPVFISPGFHDFSVSVDASFAPIKYQIDCFMYDMRVQLLSSSTAPRLKLYTAINLDKLASFFGMSVEDTISELIVFKNQCIERKKLSDSSQDGFVSAAEVDFYISEDVVYIFREKQPRKIGDWLIRNTNKLNGRHHFRFG